MTDPFLTNENSLVELQLHRLRSENKQLRAEISKLRVSLKHGIYEEANTITSSTINRDNTKDNSFITCSVKNELENKSIHLNHVEAIDIQERSIKQEEETDSEALIRETNNTSAQISEKEDVSSNRQRTKLFPGEKINYAKHSPKKITVTTKIHDASKINLSRTVEDSNSEERQSEMNLTENSNNIESFPEHRESNKKQEKELAKVKSELNSVNSHFEAFIVEVAEREAAYREVYSKIHEELNERFTRCEALQRQVNELLIANKVLRESEEKMQELYEREREHTRELEREQQLSEARNIQERQRFEPHVQSLSTKHNKTNKSHLLSRKEQHNLVANRISESMTNNALLSESSEDNKVILDGQHPSSHESNENSRGSNESRRKESTKWGVTNIRSNVKVPKIDKVVNNTASRENRKFIGSNYNYENNFNDIEEEEQTVMSNNNDIKSVLTCQRKEQGNNIRTLPELITIKAKNNVDKEESKLKNVSLAVKQPYLETEHATSISSSTDNISIEAISTLRTPELHIPKGAAALRDMYMLEATKMREIQMPHELRKRQTVKRSREKFDSWNDKEMHANNVNEANTMKTNIEAGDTSLVNNNNNNNKNKKNENDTTFTSKKAQIAVHTKRRSHKWGTVSNSSSCSSESSLFSRFSKRNGSAEQSLANTLLINKAPSFSWHNSDITNEITKSCPSNGNNRNKNNGNDENEQNFINKARKYELEVSNGPLLRQENIYSSRIHFGVDPIADYLKLERNVRSNRERELLQEQLLKYYNESFAALTESALHHLEFINDSSTHSIESLPEIWSSVSALANFKNTNLSSHIQTKVLEKINNLLSEKFNEFTQASHTMEELKYEFIRLQKWSVTLRFLALWEPYHSVARNNESIFINLTIPLVNTMARILRTSSTNFEVSKTNSNGNNNNNNNNNSSIDKQFVYIILLWMSTIQWWCGFQDDIYKFLQFKNCNINQIAEGNKPDYLLSWLLRTIILRGIERWNARNEFDLDEIINNLYESESFQKYYNTQAKNFNVRTKWTWNEQWDEFCQIMSWNNSKLSPVCLSKLLGQIHDADTVKEKPLEEQFKYEIHGNESEVIPEGKCKSLLYEQQLEEEERLEVELETYNYYRI